jgi:nitrate/TMAO reductase-like tetraheme cytochrome c subunit
LERILSWVKRAALAVVVLVPAAIAFMFLSFEVSSQPQFCGSCHIMAPYYQSWLTSTHKDFACVECHIPPGITSEFRKKYEALSMVARYFTGTYSTNPWTEVDDQSCLRSGCHTKRVLLGRELYRGVLFDHQPHLAEMRREKQLRCTSCHSQIVQGSHISVTPSTCFLCHFKDTAPNVGTARCTLCHAVPDKMITTAGLAFNHGDVKRFDMDCMACHEGVVKGEGDVLRERCFTCHNEEDRLRRFGETEFLHRMHVTDHKVECLNCHIEIVHQVPAREEALATACERCHSAAAGHSPVRDLYRGIGGKGVAPRPAAMYLAGIRCEACHNAVHGEAGRASEVSCMACHGPKYRAIFQSWQVGVGTRLEGVKAELARARTALDVNGRAEARTRLADAEANVALVEQGHGIHNPAYAVDLLEAAYRTSIETLTAAGKPRPAAPPWLAAPYTAECLRCHVGIEYQSPLFDGREFPHATHVVTARLRCATCHADMKRHGTTTIAAADCQRCHERITKPMAEVPAEECLTCHAADLGRAAAAVRFPHDAHITLGLDCGLCHTGVGDQPHRAFTRTAGAVPQPSHTFCGTCHADHVLGPDGLPPEGADCAKCHVAS